MFTLNLGYHLDYHTHFPNLRGAMLLVAGNYSHRSVSDVNFQRLFIDPQMYLSGLDVTVSSKVCAKLSTYPWFQVPNIPVREDFEKVKEWTDAVNANIAANWPGRAPTNVAASARSAIDFQIENGCSHIILPSPLITNREDECATQIEWLDRGMEIIAEIEPGQPFLATVALDESVLDATSFTQNGFLDHLLDQYTARGDLRGVYIVVNQTYSRHPFETSKNVLRAYLHLVKGFSNAGFENVVVNFADIFGLVCLAFGATTFALGKSQGLRRLSFQGMEDEGGGIALPLYYSHKSVSEYLSEEDINELISRRLYQRICDDTPHSINLTEAINTGSNASNVPQWAESQSNVTAAHKHFIEKMVREGIALQNGGATLESIRQWVEDVDMRQVYLQNRVNRDYPQRSASVQDWLSLIDEYSRV